MSNNSNEERNLYQYIRCEIMGYSEEGLSNTMKTSVRNLNIGYCFNDNGVKKKIAYGYDIVLSGFKRCEPTIKNAIQTKRFISDEAKLKYVCKIVENKLPEIYQEYQAKAKHNENVLRKLDNDDTLYAQWDGSEIKRNTNTKVPEWKEKYWY